VQDTAADRPSTTTVTARRPWRTILAVILGVVLLVALAVVFGQGNPRSVNVSPTAHPTLVAAVDTGNSRNDGSLALITPPTPTSTPLPVSTGTPVPGVAGATATAPPMGGSPSAQSPSPRALASSVGAMEAVRRIAAAETALRTGSFLVTMDYGSGVSSSVTILFAGGDGEQPMRLHTWTTYRAATDTRTVERIALGTLAWERAGNGAWAACRTAPGTATPSCSLASTVEDTLWMSWPTRPFSPNAPPGAITREGDSLYWYDAEHDADMTLRFEPNTGIPRALRAAMRINGWTIDVDYPGWNTPVSIAPPVAGSLP